MATGLSPICEGHARNMEKYKQRDKKKTWHKAENFTNMIVKIVRNASTNFCGTISLFMQERQWGCSEFVL